ncbi:MAG TPA: hypothetical protein VGH52_07035 [Gaiellaceae bacterium]
MDVKDAILDLEAERARLEAGVRSEFDEGHLHGLKNALALLRDEELPTVPTGIPGVRRPATPPPAGPG